MDREIAVRNETVEKFAEGFTRFCFGMAKKMFLANPMGEIADAIWSFDAASLPAGTAWVGLIAYTMQIYFDFSAYSDMAIGIGKTLGFKFLENFLYRHVGDGFLAAVAYFPFHMVQRLCVYSFGR